MNTFWAKAIDETHLESELYTDPPLVTGISFDTPPTPSWVESESFAGYGLNHLVLTGENYASSILKGYKIYRSQDETYANAAQIATIADQRSYGAKNSYDDHNVIPFTIYNYWCTAFNAHDNESSESSMMTISGLQPRYGELFSNYLDNSDFSRDHIAGSPITINNDINWTVSIVDPVDDGEERAPYGQYAAKLLGSAGLNSFAYSGYIFAQPSQDYYFSFYAMKGTSDTTDFTVDIEWYTADREALISSFTLVYDTTTIVPVNEWNRYDLSDSDDAPTKITAPTNATNCKIVVNRAGSTTGRVYLDALQWEEYSSTESPRPYVNSRVSSADRMQAHFIKGDMLEFNTLKGDKIQANTISGREILAGSITADLFQTVQPFPVMKFGQDLISSGAHTIFLSGGDLAIFDKTYNITAVQADDAGDTEDGLLFTTVDNSDSYYGYYNNTTNSGTIHFTDTLADALTNGDFIVGRWTNTTATIADGEVYENAGFFLYDGPYAGPNVTIKGNQITAGVISGNMIQANSLTADRIRAGVFGNLIKNSTFKAIPYEGSVIDDGHVDEGGFPITRAVQDWSFFQGIAERGPGSESVSGDMGVGYGDVTNFNELYDTNYGPQFGFNVLKMRTLNSPALLQARSKDFLPIVPGESFRLSTYYMIGNTTPGTTFQTALGVFVYDINFNHINTAGAGVVGFTNRVEIRGAGDNPYVHYEDTIDATASNRDQWLRTGYDLVVTNPFAMYIQPVIVTLDDNTALAQADKPYFYFDGVQLSLGTLDPVVTDHTTRTDGVSIVANSILANSIAAGTITATEIAAQTITANQLAANSVTADKIQAGSIEADKLGVGTHNLIRNANFDKASLDTKFVEADDNVWMAGWRFRKNGVNFKWRRDAENVKFGKFAVMASGTAFDTSSSSTYMNNLHMPVESRGILVSGSAIDAGKQYSWGYWLYKWPGSDDASGESVFVFRDASGSNVVARDTEFDLTSVDDGTWTFVEDTYLAPATTTHAYFEFRPIRASESPFVGDYKVTIDGIRVVQGNTVPQNYISEYGTLIQGDDIRTGTINAQLVKVQASGTSILLDSGGLTVGDRTGVHSTLSDTSLKFFDSNQYVHEYAKRVDLLHGLEIGTEHVFSTPYEEAPTIAVLPGFGTKTYDTTYTASDQYLALGTTNVTATGFTPTARLFIGAAGSSQGVTWAQKDVTGFYDIATRAGDVENGDDNVAIDGSDFGFWNDEGYSANEISIQYDLLIGSWGHAGGTDHQGLIVIQIVLGEKQGTGASTEIDNCQVYTKEVYGDPSTHPAGTSIHVYHHFSGLNKAIDYAYQVRAYSFDDPTGGYFALWSVPETTGDPAIYFLSPTTSVDLTGDGTVKALVVEGG
jgi:hypothetical protein